MAPFTIWTLFIARGVTTNLLNLILPEIEKIVIRKTRTREPLELIYNSISEKSYTALLLTGKVLNGHRWSILGLMPFLIFKGRGRSICIEYGKSSHYLTGDPFLLLQEVLTRYEDLASESRLINEAAAGNIPFSGGAIGAFSYDLKHIVEDIPGMCEDKLKLWDVFFCFFKKFFVRDEAENLLFEIDVKTREDTLIGDISEKGRGKTPEPALSSNFTREEYKDAICKVKEYIREGAIYQANISQQFNTGFSGDTFRLFWALNEMNPAPMSAYLDFGDFRLISSSPERFLRKCGRRIESRPIKGTRPRGQGEAADASLREELVKSKKDSAELAMIVDLVRNDLGKSARVGTVEVTCPKLIEAYTNVFHSLAIVSSQLRDGVKPLELIRSCFPGGSVTGCPKVQSMKVIEEIERNKRSFYCGSIGYIGFNGNFDLNIGIRTFIYRNSRLYFNLGGGIVYDSDPESEYEETLHKGETMVEILEKM